MTHCVCGFEAPTLEEMVLHVQKSTGGELSRFHRMVVLTVEEQKTVDLAFATVETIRGLRHQLIELKARLETSTWHHDGQKKHSDALLGTVWSLLNTNVDFMVDPQMLRTYAKAIATKKEWP